MSATTAMPTADPKVRESFLSVITSKIKAGRARGARFLRACWSHLTSGARATGRGARKTAAATGRGARTVGRWGAYGGAGLLAGIGRGVFSIGRFIGMTLAYAVVGIALLLVAAIMLVAGVIEYVLYLVIKLLYLIGLALSTPWVALRHGKSVAREDWEIFRVGLKPRNWHIVAPGALAARLMEERKTKSEAGQPATAEQPGAARQDGQAASTQHPGKGRPTPRRRSNRPAKLPTVAVAQT